MECRRTAQAFKARKLDGRTGRLPFMSCCRGTSPNSSSLQSEKAGREDRKPVFDIGQSSPYTPPRSMVERLPRFRDREDRLCGSPRILVTVSSTFGWRILLYAARCSLT